MRTITHNRLINQFKNYIQMKKTLKIYYSLPNGWKVCKDFTTVKNGYVGINNCKNPFTEKYENGQILDETVKHLL